MTSLALERLSPSQLHDRTRHARARLGRCEWELANCLLAVDRTRMYLRHSCSSAVHYAVEVLELCAHKASELLRAARALENLPQLANCFRTGKLSWSKIREVTRVATPDSEADLVTFALRHSCDVIQQALVRSPRAQQLQQEAQRLGPDLFSALGPLEKDPSTDRQRVVAGSGGPNCLSPSGDGPQAPQPGALPNGLGAVAASGAPSGASRDEVDDDSPPNRLGGCADGPRSAGSTVSSTGSGRGEQDRARESQAESASDFPFEIPGGIQAETGGGQRPAGLPVAPVCVKLYFSPDEFAVWEKAGDRVRSSNPGRRLTKAQVAAAMAARVLQAPCSAPARVRHMVVVHVDASTESGYYETGRGVLRASPAVVQEALETGVVMLDQSGPKLPGEGTAAGPGPSRPAAPGPALSGLEEAGRDGSGPTAPRPNRTKEPFISTSLDGADRPEEMGDAGASDGQAESAQPGRANGQTGAERARGLDQPASSEAPRKEGSKGANGSSGRKVDHGRRTSLPMHVLRAVFARAGGRCEIRGCCNPGPYYVHHRKPWSQGGRHTLDNLQVRCAACHSQAHDEDYAKLPDWRAARQRKTGQKSRRGRSA